MKDYDWIKVITCLLTTVVLPFYILRPHRKGDTCVSKV